MNTLSLTEEKLAEQPALKWFKELGYELAFGPDISPGGLHPERDSFNDVVLKRRLRSALEKPNPHLPQEAIEDALHQLLSLDSPNTFVNNHQFHQLAVSGVKVELTTAEGERRGDFARVLDFDNPANNDFMVVNQFTVIEGEHNRRPDVVVFVNGLPLAVLEVKNPAGYERPLDAFRKNITTYKKEITELFYYNFILFETDGGKIVKKMAMYHQYYGVNRAINETIRATAEEGDRKIGAIWHTQGSGKSLSMVFFTAIRG